MEENKQEFDMYGEEPPIKRENCLNNERPCPWVRCKHHMLWAYHEKILKKLTDDELCDKIFTLKETCSLDVADQGGGSA